jgi:hypothetical protein
VTVGLHASRPQRLRRLATLVVATAAATGLLTQCTPAPVEQPSPTSSAPTVTASPTPGRSLTDANLLSADDLPEPIGGGKVSVDTRNARSLDHLTICEQEPFGTLGATESRSRSFKDSYRGSDHPFPHSVLDNQPDTYAVALQFADAAAAERARAIIHGWVLSCREGVNVPDNVQVTTQGFDWAQLAVRPGTAEIAEVVYRDRSSTNKLGIWESIGLTLVEDRLMVTVHLYSTDESPYSVNLDDDESGFAHPQVTLVRESAIRLGR